MRGDTKYRFSASQIDTFDVWKAPGEACERKWAWDRIGKIPRSQHPSAALGTKCHSQFERYLTTGAHPTHSEVDGLLDVTGAIVEPALASLPAPMSPTLEVEKKFLFQSPTTGFWYGGFIDWRRLVDPDLAEVGDHKSTSNLKYAKTALALETDPQGVLYAKDTLDYFHVDRVRLHWNYVQTKRPYRHLPVITEVARGGVESAFEGLEAITERMAEYLDTIGPEDIMSVPGNTRACRAYNSVCPYAHKCNLSPLESMHSLFSEFTKEGLVMPEMTALERLRARQNGVPAAPEPAQTALALSAATTPALGKLPPAEVNNGATNSPKVPCSVCGLETVGGTVEKTSIAPGRVGYRHTTCSPLAAPVAPHQINPPEHSVIPTAEQLADAERAAKGAPAPVAPEGAGGRIRRTKDEIARGLKVEQAAAERASKGASMQVEAPASSDTITVTPQGDVSTTPVQPVAPIQLLCLDCVPVKGLPYQDASALIAAANKLVCDAKNVNDYRYVQYVGSAMLAEAAVSLVKAASGLVLHLDTSTPEGKALVNPLSALAQFVIRG